jgi:hypothetical protein
MIKNNIKFGWLKAQWIGNLNEKMSANPFNLSLHTGHRAHTVYVGVHVPARRSHRRRKHLPKDISEKGSQDSQERPGKENKKDLTVKSTV